MKSRKAPPSPPSAQPTRASTEDAALSSATAIHLRGHSAEAESACQAILASTMGKRDEAIATFERAIALRPDSVAAYWSRSMAHLPVIHPDEEDVTRTRAAYEASLKDLAARFDGWTQAPLA
jgi:hypothetical protein